MFGRRVPPHVVFAGSLLLALACAALAFVAFSRGSLIWGALAGVLAVWFTVDAVRSYGWAQERRRQAQARVQEEAQRDADRTARRR